MTTRTNDTRTAGPQKSTPQMTTLLSFTQWFNIGYGFKNEETYSMMEDLFANTIGKARHGAEIFSNIYNQNYFQS